MESTADDNSDKPVHEGWIKKQGDFLKTWNDRYFRLYPDSLHYFSSETSKSSKGFIYLKDITDIRTTSFKDRDYCLIITLLVGNSYLLALRSSAEQRIWFQHIWKTRNAAIAEIGRQTMETDEAKNMKVFTADEVHLLCKSIVTAKSVIRLKDSLKLLRNCADYLSPDELLEQRQHFTSVITQSQANCPEIWDHGLKRLADQIFHRISPEYIESLKKHIEQEKLHPHKRNSVTGNSVVAQIVNIEQIYKFGKRLGSGTFSTVHIGQDKRTGERFAIKCIRKCKLSKNDVSALITEVDVMMKLKSHPNIVNFMGFYQDTKYYYLVQELCLGGELFNRIVERTYYSEYEAKEISRTLIATLGYCHALGIVHRDLKPENILLADRDDDYSLKVADFGFARQVAYQDNNLLKTSCGSPGYVAPEILQNKLYGSSVDMWSLGVIIYILLCGFPPFHNDNQAILFNLIKKGEYKFPSPYWDHVSKNAKDFISHLLVVDPDGRYTAKQALADQWLAQNPPVLPDADRRDGMNNNTSSGLVQQQQQPNLQSAVQMLEQFNARRKLKAGMRAVRTGIRLRKLSTPLQSRKPTTSNMDDKKEDSSSTYISTFWKLDTTKYHIVRSAPDLLTPSIGKLPAGSRIIVDDDIINMYGWWLKLSVMCAINSGVSDPSSAWVMGQAPGQSVLFEREIALKYESLLPSDDLHAVYEEPVLEGGVQIGQINGGKTILGVTVVDNKDGKWLQVFANQFDNDHEGYTMISDVNGKVYFHMIENIERN